MSSEKVKSPRKTVADIVLEGIVEYLEDMEDTYTHIGSSHELLKREMHELDEALKSKDVDKVNKILGIEDL